MRHVSRVTYHMSYVMCHMSHVVCHMSQQQQNGQSGGASRSRVCYQQGLPRLVLLEIFICVYSAVQ